ncbi:MAG: guanylate kinase [Clostridia bacterium]|nr:guanylate kinase [Oscillospiraceae bacterium]MBO5358921.1 guanylate kinase [Clostridia bacterium]
MSKGGVFVVAGPSGSGKDTLFKELFKRRPEIKFSISSITRPMRVGEVEGEKYNFITREKFLSMLENDELLEYNEYIGNYYGTPKAPVIAAIEKGQDILIEVDVNGAKEICEKLPEAVTVFIMPPSYQELKRRLSGRGTETQELIDKRMKEALNEIARATEFDYIVVNDDINTAVDDIIEVISSSRLTLKRQKNLIDGVLSNVES